MSHEYAYDWSKFDKGLILQFNWFLRKVNDRANIEHGFVDSEYHAVARDGTPDPGLGRDVEYFHPNLVLDDRMRFIMKEIAPSGGSDLDIVGNTLISHFFGARGVHFAISGKEGTLVDFDAALTDKDYLRSLRENLDNAKRNRVPIWGTTELHTSIQAAARNFCRKKYSEPDRAFHPVDVVEWVASFGPSGIVDSLLEANHIHEAFKVLRTLPGIGEYYGFHGAASTSVLPQMRYHHDQRFVAPGPGAVDVISRIWPEAPKKLHAEAIYYMRENAEKIGLTEGVVFHPSAYDVDGILGTNQDGLKHYGTEVASCQFGVYLRIRNDPKLCEKRKVARAPKSDSTGFSEFFS